MPAPNILYANTSKIESIQVIDERSTLIDIEVEDQHTFWISENESDWTLTHNSGAPDIDCVDSQHFVAMDDGTFKKAGDIVVGDLVWSGSGIVRPVTAVYARSLRPDEKPLSIVVMADDDALGHIYVVPNHKFVKADGSIVRAHELVVGDALMASTGVKVGITSLSTSEERTFVDMTVEADHTFNIVPFDVIELDDGLVLTMGYAA